VLAAAAGAVGAVVVQSIAEPVTALADDDGSAILVGSSFLDVRSTTFLQNTANDDPVFSALSAGDQHGGGDGVYGGTHSGNGVYGEATGSGTGVYAISQSGYGLFAHGEQATGGHIETVSQYGAGLEVAIANTANRRGAIESTTNGGGAAVYGTTSGAGPGVWGYATGMAPGLKGTSALGRGAVVAGKKAQLKLAPSAALTHPTSGQMGDLFVDKSGRLWFCKGATTWKQLA
jgi:hypothetical protein